MLVIVAFVSCCLGGENVAFVVPESRAPNP